MWINTELFKLKKEDFPQLPPELSYESQLWWKEQRRRCIEGYWVGGRYMPGNYYFYLNFWTIIKNDKRGNRVYGRPDLWDIHWEIAYGVSEARGLAGFSEQKEIKQLLSIIDNLNYEERQAALKQLPNIRDVLYNSNKDLGTPVYLHRSKDYMLMGARGSGKEQPVNEIVMTKEGPIKMGDVIVGTEIIGRDGNFAKVSAIFPQGKKQVWKLKLSDGRTVTCGREHLWVVSINSGKEKVLTTEQMYTNGIKYKHSKSGFTYKYSLPIGEAINYSEKEFPLDPYILGCLLGDGTTTTLTPKIASSDLFIIEEFKKRLPDFEIRHDSGSTNNYTIVDKNKVYTEIKTRKGRFLARFRNRLTTILRDLKVNVKCRNKFIPEIYKYGSIGQRMELLRGLMDTDGSVNKEGACEFTNTSEQLVQDVMDLCRGLGIKCQLGVDTREGQVRNVCGNISVNNGNYRVYINTSESIFKLPRKLERLKKFKKSDKYVSIIDLYPTEEYVEQQCILVDNIDHTYLTRDFIVTHNSMYLAGAEIGHQFLFDGLRTYKPMSEVNESSSTVVGAGHTEFSGKLLLKVKMGFDYLPGATTINGEYYPPPFSKQFKGTLGNNTIKVIAEYDIKEGENWVTKGTKSNITHVAFKDNPFAAAGESTNTLIIDECGLCGNLLAIEEATIDCVERSGNRFGTRIYAGTGGEMDEGTIPSSMMFVNPEKHGLVSYEDIYEYKGNIAYFIPKNRALDIYKDKDGNTIEPDATKYVEKKREVLRKESHSSSKLDAEKQNNPMVPAEMFLAKTGNIFPKGELQNHLASLRTEKKYKGIGDVGEFTYNDKGELLYTLIEEDRYITFFPHDPKAHDIRGAWIIWEYPETDAEGKVPQNLYIAGNDPYDHDQSGTVSLGSTFIYKKIFTTTGTQETIVAEYTGRHEKGSNAYYEQVARGLKFFGNARLMHENINIGLYKYFEQKNLTYLLMDVPEYAKEMTGSQPNRQKGMHFGTGQIRHGELLIKNWLEEEIAPGILQLTKIKSPALIQELIHYNNKGNFDRVRAFMAVLYAREETHRIVVKTLEKEQEDNYFTRNFKKAIPTDRQTLFGNFINAGSVIK